MSRFMPFLLYHNREWNQTKYTKTKKEESEKISMMEEDILREDVSVEYVKKISKSNCYF